MLRLLLAAPRTDAHAAVARATHDPSSPLPHLVSALLSLPLDAATAFDEEPPSPSPSLREGGTAAEGARCCGAQDEDAVTGSRLAACLVTLLDASLARTPPPADTHTPAPAPGPATPLTAPLLALLRRIHALTTPTPRTTAATPAQLAARAHLAARLLPRPVDRLLPLGTGPSLPHRLLRLLSPSLTSSASAVGGSSSADAPAAASLLLELCGHDGDTLVRHIGFGLASGVLADAALPAPSSYPASTASSTTAAAAATVQGQPVDFVTGQFVEARDAAAAAAAATRDFHGGGGTTATHDMSDDEKLREAERLYVLFERLRATGVVRAENPVHAAARGGGAGRFAEVAEADDDDDEEH